MDYGWRAEVAHGDACLGSVIDREGVGVFTRRLGVVDWHQSRTCVPSDPEFHGDDTTRFLCIEGGELGRVELSRMQSGTVERRGIGTCIEDCLWQTTEMCQYPVKHP